MNLKINTKSYEEGKIDKYLKLKKKDLKKNELLDKEPEICFPIECTNCNTNIGFYLYSKKMYVLEEVIESNG